MANFNQIMHSLSEDMQHHMAYLQTVLERHRERIDELNKTIAQYEPFVIFYILLATSIEDNPALKAQWEELRMVLKMVVPDFDELLEVAKVSSVKEQVIQKALEDIIKL